MLSGVVYVAASGFTSASRASALLGSADERATSTARAATRSASSAVRIGDAAKPHAPSALARTEKPKMAERATAARRPRFTRTPSPAPGTQRTAEYGAPRQASASRAARDRAPPRATSDRS